MLTYRLVLARLLGDPPVAASFAGSRLQDEQATAQAFGAAAGRVLGCDGVRIVAVGAHLRATCAVIRYEQDPLFIAIAHHEDAAGRRPRNVEFNDDTEAVFPAALLRP